MANARTSRSVLNKHGMCTEYTPAAIIRKLSGAIPADTHQTMRHMYNMTNSFMLPDVQKGDDGSAEPLDRKSKPINGFKRNLACSCSSSKLQGANHAGRQGQFNTTIHMSGSSNTNKQSAQSPVVPHLVISFSKTSASAYPTSCNTIHIQV
jgi:hypothetical protein